jgi:single-strand DNA-binding protein
MSLNIVTLVGRVGGDPEVKYFETGKVVCNFNIAINRYSRDRGEHTDWFTLELWNKDAEIAANYVKKGRLIGVKGSLKFDYWQDKATGVSRSKPVIRVDKWQLLDSKKDHEENSQSGPNYDEF